MLERAVESHLCRRVKRAGGEVIKLPVRERRGRPDRLVLMPQGRVYFIELKAPGKKLKKHQLREQERLWRMGFNAFVIDTKPDVDCFMAWVTNGRGR
jgi:hypothetical protein